MLGIFRKITIRTNILTNFIVVVALVAAILLFLQYHFSRKMALKATESTFKHIAQKITYHVEDNDRFIRALLHQMTLYPDITVEPVRQGLPENAVRFARTMARSRSIYSMYVGYPDGNLFEVINMRSAVRLPARFHAPEETRWAVARVFNASSGRVWQYDFLDKTLRWLARRQVPTQYNVKKRPWYILAKKHGGVVRSIPYLFASLGRKGITYSRIRSGSESVVAIDFTLERIETFLKSQVFAPTAVVDMFDGKGELIASSNEKGTTNQLFLKMLKKAVHGKVVIDNSGNRQRFVMVMPLSGHFGGKTYLGFSVDTSVMLGPYLKEIYFAFGMALLALLLSLPLVILTTSMIVKPVKALMKENEKIKERSFDNVRPIQTHIIELIELSDSLISMSQSIQEYEKSLEEMLDSFIKLIADAIDAKSTYTGGHCKRVPILALDLARAAAASEDDPFGAFHFETEAEWKAFEMGAWLHDCGKITTPEFVVDKATKLETIYNRIHEIRTRFEVIWRDIDIAYYERLLRGENREGLEKWREREQKQLLDDFSFVAACNVGDEFLSKEKKMRLLRIAERTWLRHFSSRVGISEIERRRFGDKEEPFLPVAETLLSDKPEHLVHRTGFDDASYREKGFKLEDPDNLYNFGEIYNLSIEKGTLTKEEIYKIREHVIMTIEMLERLPYPEELKKIPGYAGTHHETVNGTGYPRRLTRENLSIPERIMAIADIFEALTASDRPYKKGKTLSEALKIMQFMVKDAHLDADLFVLFIQAGIYRRYAEVYLKPEQIDEVDEEALINFI